MSFIIEPNNPLIDPQPSGPEGKGPVFSNRKGKWDEASVERDLPFIEEAMRIINTAKRMVQPVKGDTTKASLRQELEQAGWQYNSRATFKANFPFRGKYIVMDSSYKRAYLGRYRIKVMTGQGILLGYKIMKWIEKTGSAFELFDLFTTKRGILFFVIGIIVLSTFIPVVCSLVFR